MKRQSLTERSEDIFGSDTFLQRVGATVIIAVLVVALLMLFWYVVDVVLVLFAAILFAIFLNALARKLSKYTRMPYSAAIGVTLALLTAVFALAVFLLAPSVSAQVTELYDELPRAVAKLGGEIVGTQWGAQLFGELTVGEVLGGVPKRAVSIFSSMISALTSFALVIGLGIYLALEPQLYRRGLITLFPVKKRARAESALDSMHSSLQRWLIGTFIAMSFVGLLTFLGLYFLGVPLALVLGILAGILEFIPVIGFLIAMVPAVLLAALESPALALYVVLLGLGIQTLQNYVVTPLITRRTVHLPPALLLVTQVLFGVLFGFLGVMFATPLLIVVVILVKMLYVEDVLGDEAHVTGKKP